MKLFPILRVLWGVILIVLLASFIYSRLPELKAGNSTFADCVVFLVLMCLLLTPLFSEVEILGVSVKRKLEELKESVAEQIHEVRSEIRTAVEMRNSQTTTLNVQPQLSDAALQLLKQEIREGFVALGAGAAPETLEGASLGVTAELRQIFAIRYSLERELRRIGIVREVLTEGPGPFNVHVMVQTLMQQGLVDGNGYTAMRELYAVCSKAIHGHELTRAQLQFALDTGPELIAALRAIK